MSTVLAIAKRELKSYFATPIAAVFLVVFVVLCGVFTFQVGRLFDRGVADLAPFFNYLPWLFLILIPAVAMRLWAEERKSGTIELLMTLPVSPGEAVTGKWLAGTLFVALALVLTFPMWITVNILGDPDNGVILANYIAALALASVFLALGGCASAFTRNQVVALVLSVVGCFILLTAGMPLVLDAISGYVPTAIIDAVRSISALSHFTSIARGVLLVPDLVWVVSMVVFWLFATVAVISLKKAD
ncbi:MAG: ABC transporter permease subunit [Rhizobiales bacterium]|nr:ABC transporter permease subunit [Hyphomicrobiales bacterium]